MPAAHAVSVPTAFGSSNRGDVHTRPASHRQRDFGPDETLFTAEMGDDTLHTRLFLSGHHDSSWSPTIAWGRCGSGGLVDDAARRRGAVTAQL
jgi:hypothetical protein